MRISRIYYNDTLKLNETICLPPEASHYVINVLRLKGGSSLIVFNGDGIDYLCTLTHFQKKHAYLSVCESIPRYSTESPLKIHLVQGISRGEKMDWIIQKAVELGVHRITPLITEFCSVRLEEERMTKRLLHWRKIMISACEQSGRAVLPTLDNALPYSEWIQHNTAPLTLYCDPSCTARLSTVSPSTEVRVMIGPEGGFSPMEIELAKNHHYQGITLGPRILRTETAAVTIVALLQNLWGDL